MFYQDLSNNDLSKSWDIYNEYRQVIGRKERDKPLEPGEYHLRAGLFLFNQEGKILLQKRYIDNKHENDIWDVSVIGSATAKENSLQAIKRETKEQLGIDLPIKKTNLISRKFYTDWFCDWFYYQLNIKNENLKTNSLIKKIQFFSPEKADSQLKRFGIGNVHNELFKAESKVKRNS